MAAAQDWQRAIFNNLIQERVVGLLNLPEVVGGGGCGPTQPVTADLYEIPSTARPAIGSIEFLVGDREADGSSCSGVAVIVRRAGTSAVEQLPTEESGYEVPAAIVYQRSGLWFRVALQRGSAWTRRQNSSDFQSYPEMLTGHLDYLKRDWNGELWRVPGTGTGVALPPEWTQYLSRQIPVDILAMRRIRNDVWIQVQLKTEVCGETLTGVRSITGWIPAYGASASPSVWFYSRGC